MEKNIFLKTLKLFGSKGSRFTTDDLAKELGTSKRTIYSLFSGKDEIIEKTIDYVFSEISISDTEIYEKAGITYEEKINLCLNNIPYAYNLSAIIGHMDDLAKHYPSLLDKVNNYMNSIWDRVIGFVEQGIQNGEIEEVNTVILKLIFNEAFKKLLDHEFITRNQVSFDSGIRAMNDIILYGLIKTKSDNKTK
jgi:AcrR family transcriptional regulator